MKSYKDYGRAEYVPNEKKDIELMNIDIQGISNPFHGTIKIYGVTEEGNSAMVMVRDFYQYLYCAVVEGPTLSEAQLERLKQRINEQFAQRQEAKISEKNMKDKRINKEAVIRITYVKKVNMKWYKSEEQI